MPTMQGVVRAKNPKGILLAQGDWLNWTKPEYQKEPWDADKVQKGDVVTLEVADDNEGNPKWISSIKITGPSQDVTPRDRPLEEVPTYHGDFPPEDVETRPEAPQMGPMEQGDVLYTRTAALNAAVSIAPSTTHWGTTNSLETQKALIKHLADEFEDWLGR